ncbi:MAG: hypothetical protein LBT48_07635 [Prevotellaceae bacterium]|nr:hypothetical protein [Prevotellaceae bacterium]
MYGVKNAELKIENCGQLPSLRGTKQSPWNRAAVSPPIAPLHWGLFTSNTSCSVVLGFALLPKANCKAGHRNRE